MIGGAVCTCIFHVLVLLVLSAWRALVLARVSFAGYYSLNFFLFGSPHSSAKAKNHLHFRIVVRTLCRCLYLNLLVRLSFKVVSSTCR